MLVGDFLFARAFQLMVADGSLKVLAILSRAAATIAEGEVLQLVTQNDLSTTEEPLSGGHPRQDRRPVRRRLPGRRRGRRTGRRRRRRRWRNTALNLGIAFQLVDDALDYAADQAKLGKTVGDDFREGKITLPVLARLRRRATPRSARSGGARIEDSEQTDDDLDQAMGLMARHGAIARTLDRAARFADAGQGEAGGVPGQPDPPRA